MRTQFTVLQVLQEQLQQQRSVAGQAEAASRGGKVFRGLLVCVCRQNKSLLRPMLVDAFDLSGKRHCCIGDALYVWSAFSHRFLNYIIAASILPQLPALLRSDKPAVQEASAGALCSLALQKKPTSPSCNLAPGHQHKYAIVAAGAVSLLVALLRYDQPLAKDSSRRFASPCSWLTDAIVAAGAVPLLVAMLKSNQLDARAAAAAAAGALGSKAAGFQQFRDANVAAGALPLLTALLGSEQPLVQQKAADALRLVAGGSQLTTDAIMAATAVPLLTAMLESGKPAVQKQAADALWNIDLESQHNEDVIAAPGSVPLLLC